MTLWIFITLLSAITLLVLLFSARNKGEDNSEKPVRSETEEHFKLQLADIETNFTAGKLSETDAQVARAELAREIVLHRAALPEGASDTQGAGQKRIGWLLGGTSLLSIGLALVIYMSLGSPDQTIFTQPSSEQVSAQQDLITEDFNVALERVEQQMIADPGDIRGWQVLAPAYMRLQRFDEAVVAYRKILELAPPTADSQTDLAEALLMASEGAANSEIIQLLQEAAQADETHARSRFYLAAEATSVEQWDEAIAYWQELLALGTGQEQWVEIAQNGLAVAMARGELVPDQVPANESRNVDTAAVERRELIRSMVQGLDERLRDEGGTIEEWTRLVRSFVVLGETNKALNAYEAAIIAYPDVGLRDELEALAQQAGFAKN